MPKTLNLRQKLVEVRKSITAFYKDTKGFNYRYVSGSQVLEKIRPMMDDLGLLLIPSIEHNSLYEKIMYEKKNPDYVVNCKMTYTRVNADKPSETLVCDWSMFGKQDDPSKAFGSGLTYSERYFLMKFFDIPTDDEDPDARQGEVVKIPQKTAEVVKTPEPTNNNSVGQPQSDDVDNPMDKDFRYNKFKEEAKEMIVNVGMEKGANEITAEDVKKIGVELQTLMKAKNNSDPDYVRIRDEILMPFINQIGKKK